MINALNAQVVYNMEVLKYFDTETYTWRFDIVQNFSCLIFRLFYLKLSIRKYLKQFSTQLIDVVLLTIFIVQLFETFCPKICIRKYLKQFSTKKINIV